MFGDVPQSEAVLPTLEVVHSDGSVGDSAGNRKVLVKCVKCGKPGLAKHNDAQFTWIHSELLTALSATRMRRRTISKCTTPRFKKS